MRRLYSKYISILINPPPKKKKDKKSLSSPEPDPLLLLLERLSDRFLTEVAYCLTAGTRRGILLPSVLYTVLYCSSLHIAISSHLFREGGGGGILPPLEL